MDCINRLVVGICLIFFTFITGRGGASIPVASRKGVTHRAGGGSGTQTQASVMVVGFTNKCVESLFVSEWLISGAGWLAGQLAGRRVGWLAGSVLTGWLAGWLAVTMWCLPENTNGTVTNLGMTITVFAREGQANQRSVMRNGITSRGGAGSTSLVTNVTKISLIT